MLTPPSLQTLKRNYYVDIVEKETCERILKDGRKITYERYIYEFNELNIETAK